MSTRGTPPSPGTQHAAQSDVDEPSASVHDSGNRNFGTRGLGRRRGNLVQKFWRHRVALIAATVVSAYSLLLSAGNVASAATKPASGGSITEGNWSYSGLDQGQSGYTGG